MKKFVQILVPFLVLASSTLSGCKKEQKTEEEKVLLSFGDVHAENVTEINTSRFAELIKSKESFLFAISSSGCSCWSNFRVNMEKYLQENKLVCYYIPFKDFKDDAYLYGISGISDSTTTFIIYENGQIKHKLNSQENKNTMENYSSFVEFMDNKIEKPRCFYIDYSDFSVIKNSGENAVIYYERYKCDDCSSINRTILKDYVKNHENMKKLYVLDCQSIWKDSRDEDYFKYLQDKALYGMAEESNPYGFSTGVFPFFSFIKNKEYESGCVIYNDELTKVDDNTYKISKTYYTSERIATLHYNVPSPLIDRTLNKNSDVIETASGYAYWNQEKANSYYSQVLDSFLNYSLPQVTYTF